MVIMASELNGTSGSQTSSKLKVLEIKIHSLTWRLIRRYRIEISIFIFTLFAYHLSNLNHIGWYNHYVYLADALIHGRLNLEGELWKYPLYNSDIVYVNGKAYIPFPPMPAILLIPWTLFFGLNTNQEFMTQLIGAINLVLAYKLFRRLKCNLHVALSLTVLLGFGTVHWYASMIGTTWFYAHIVAVFFTLLALLELSGRSRPLIMGVLLGAAFFSRQLMILSTPLFLMVLLKKGRGKLKGPIKFLAALALIVSLYCLYNYVRLGSIFDSTYNMLYAEYKPEAAERYGMFDINWIPSGIYIMLLKGPEIIGQFPNMPLTFPYFKPSPYGMSLLLVTPVFLYALRARDKDPLTVGCWISVLAISTASLMYFNHGWVQFGYRFSLDFTPFLMVLLTKAFRNRITPLRLACIIYCILVNAWGVYWGNILYW